MKTFVFIIFLLVCGCTKSPQNNEPYKNINDLPDKYILNEHMIALTTTMSIEAGSLNYGSAVGEFLAFTPTFTIKDNKGNIIRKAEEKFLSWVHDVIISDSNGIAIVEIKEVWEKSFLKTWTTYEIYSLPSKTLIANSEKVDWVETNFVLKNERGDILKLHRNAINFFGDKWYIEVYQHGVLDNSVPIIIACLKTKSDNDKKKDDD